MEKENKISKTGTGTGTGTGTKTEKQEIGQHRVIITKEANQELETILEKIKDGNIMVEITKSDIANYVFMNLQKVLTDVDVKTLRNIYFDERKVLQGLLKQSTDGVDLPSEIKKMVREYYGLNERDKKRSSKSSSEAVLDS